ncbi:hypothetical protein C1645_838286 [Glomus cerebriforme]|uniref:Uncharacterized protein n=1 Tax=Glomus cerebriforme TaxID=658196 RepID=A0A397SE45_9GLOM|nr:hypothetical protein C1645_838286 [Glomus cerebriforme]
MQNFTKRINKTASDKLSEVIAEANNFIIDIKLYGDEPNYFDIAAIYEIKFPPSLWSSLTEKQQELAKKKGHSELKLKEEVQNYKFDNNALFYGAPRTGKSVMAEKLAYEADKYPLVVIQGSTLTPKKADNDIGATLLIKFIYTINEADQICTTHLLPPKDASSQLTFLKECMGSDKFMEYSKDAGIDTHKFIEANPEAEYEPEEEKDELPEEDDNNQEPKDKKLKIKLKDSSQLASFQGKFINPRDPKLEEVIKESSLTAANHISKTLDTRLNQIDETITKIEDEIVSANSAFSANLNNAVEQITSLLSAIGIIGLVCGACAAPFTGGATLAAACAACGGAGLVAGHFLDRQEKKDKMKKEKLALKGKSLEEAKKDNEQARGEEKKLREDLEKQNEENEKLGKELEQARNKLNSPSLSDEERGQ